MATDRRAAQEAYVASIEDLLATGCPIVLVSFEGATSAQVAALRASLRLVGAVLKGGKNALARWAFGKDHPLSHYLRGQTGVVFCKEPAGPVSAVVPLLWSATQTRSLRPGDVVDAPVVLPAGPTTCPPSDTVHFQAMGVATMIQRGRVSVVRDTVILDTGQRATETSARLAGIAGLEPVATAVVPVIVFEGGELAAVPSPFQVMPAESRIMALLTEINTLLAIKRVEAGGAGGEGGASGMHALSTLSWLKTIRDFAMRRINDVTGEDLLSSDDESDDGDALGIFGDDEDW